MRPCCRLLSAARQLKATATGASNIQATGQAGGSTLLLSTATPAASFVLVEGQGSADGGLASVRLSSSGQDLDQ